MLVQAGRTIFAALLLAGLSLAQEPAPAAFHVQTDLLTVTFHFNRGARSNSDLKPEDVVLLEDGVPRAFTVFEAPPSHLTLDLAVMFDVTNPNPDPKTPSFGVWNTKALHDLAGYWTEAMHYL